MRAFRALEGLMAKAVAKRATPVGSGTVARTERIPLEQRAEGTSQVPFVTSAFRE